MCREPWWKGEAMNHECSETSETTVAMGQDLGNNSGDGEEALSRLDVIGTYALCKYEADSALLIFALATRRMPPQCK